MAKANSTESQIDQLSREKRAVSSDAYDISVRQIIDMVSSDEINISPEYQRHFIWDEQRESELIESIFLGLPIPSLFMATNSDGSWEVVDGVQRISTALHFTGDKESLELIKKDKPLKLTGLKKLSSFNGFLFSNLPKSTQFQFVTRPLRVTTLNDRSDTSVRYDLFERLNTGAVILHPQEIRNCVFRGIFTDFIKDQSQNTDYRKIVKLPDNELQAAAYEECVLRFFAFRDRYKEFGHNVNEFLNDYAIYMNKRKSVKDPDDFRKTMSAIARELPDGIVRQKRKNTTPVNLYEAIAVGTGLALKANGTIKKGVLASIIDDVDLVGFTTGATNSKPKVIGRIDYVRTRLS